MDGFREALKRGFHKIVDAQKRDGAPELATGIHTVDRFTGGLRRGELTIIAGAPGVGKTALALQIAVHVAESTHEASTRDQAAPEDTPTTSEEQESLARSGAAVIYLALESTAETMALRVLSLRARTPRHAIVNGVLTHEQWTRITDAASDLWKRRLNLAIEDQPEPTIVDIRALADRASSELALLVVDFVQMVPGMHAAHTRDQQLAEVTRGLKSLAKQRNIAVIAVSQVNRAVESRGVRRPQLSDLRDTGALAHDSDNVWFLHPSAGFAEDDELDLVLAKQRNGLSGFPIRVYFDRESGTFFPQADPPTGAGDDDSLKAPPSPG